MDTMPTKILRIRWILFLAIFLWGIAFSGYEFVKLSDEYQANRFYRFLLITSICILSAFSLKIAWKKKLNPTWVIAFCVIGLLCWVASIPATAESEATTRTNIAQGDFFGFRYATIGFLAFCICQIGGLLIAKQKAGDMQNSKGTGIERR